MNFWVGGAGANCLSFGDHSILTFNHQPQKQDVETGQSFNPYICHIWRYPNKVSLRPLSCSQVWQVLNDWYSSTFWCWAANVQWTSKLFSLKNICNSTGNETHNELQLAEKLYEAEGSFSVWVTLLTLSNLSFVMLLKWNVCQSSFKSAVWRNRWNPAVVKNAKNKDRFKRLILTIITSVIVHWNQ